MLDKIKGFIAGMHMPDVQVMAENQNHFGVGMVFSTQNQRGLGWDFGVCVFFFCGESNGVFF